MRTIFALLLIFAVSSPAYAASPVDEGAFDAQTLGRPGSKSRSPVVLAAPTNQFQGFVRFSAEKRFFEAMANNKAYFRDVFTGGDTFHSDPNDGDSFSARLFGPDGSLVTTWFPVVFRKSLNGQQDCWTGFTGGTICGTTSIFITWFVRSQCFADGPYRMEFLYNSQPFFGGSFELLPALPPNSLPQNLTTTYNQGTYNGAADPMRDHYDRRCYVTDRRIRHNCDGRAGEQKNFIQQLGCYLTGAALISTYHGLTLTPPQLNDILNNTQRGFVDGDVQPDRFAAAITDRGLTLSSLGNKPKADLLRNICQFGPQLLGVRRHDRCPDHWVVATGFDRAANAFKIVDPSGGRTTTLAERYKDFCQTRTFSGPEFVVTLGSKILTTFRSPVQLLLTDPLGRRLGRDPLTGQLLEEVPDAYYVDAGLTDDEIDESEIDPPKQLFLPRPATGDYSLTVLGTADGTYSADLIAADVNGTESVTSLTNIPVAAGGLQNFIFHYDSAVGSAIQLSGGFDGGGQRPVDVNRFLSYGNPAQSQTSLPASATTFPLLIFYAQATDASTFSAILNGADVSGLFRPAPGTSEVVELSLGSGRNVLKVSIDGQLPSRVATDTDRLVFLVP